MARFILDDTGQEVLTGPDLAPQESRSWLLDAAKFGETGERTVFPPARPEPPEPADPRFIYVDPRTGRQVPVLSKAPERTMLDKIRDYMGIRQPKTTPLSLQAMRLGLRQFDIRQEVFGTGIEEEARRVVSRGVSGLTGGVSDLIRGYEEHPETWPGALAGAGAELAGFLVGPFKGMRAITGGRLRPTAKGLQGVAQVMTEGAANLGAASALAAVIPSFMASDDLTEMAFSVTESAAMGGLIGFVYPAMGAVPTRPLRLAVSLAVMDKIRAGPNQWFTADDVLRGVKTGEIDAKELAEASFGYLMDIYFTLRVPSMRKQLEALDNAYVREIAKQDVAEVERTILDLSRRGDLDPLRPTLEGIGGEDVVRRFGSEREFTRVADVVAAHTEPKPKGEPGAKEVEAMFNRADTELAELRRGSLKKTRQAVARATVDVSAEVKKRLLEDAGDVGREAVIRHDLARGASPKADHIYTQHEREVFGELDKVQTKQLDRVIQSRRVITLDRHIEAITKRIEGDKARAEAAIAETVREVRELNKQARQAVRVAEAAHRQAIGLRATERERARQTRQSALKARQAVNEAVRALERAERAHARTQPPGSTRTLPSGELLERREALTRAQAKAAEAQRIADAAEERAVRAGRDEISAQDRLADAQLKLEEAVRQEQEASARGKEFEAARDASAEELAEMRTARRETVEALREIDPLMHPEGLGETAYRDYLAALRRSDPEQFRMINERATRYFKVMKEQLTDLHRHGLISDESFRRLSAVGDYSPRRFIQHIDPDRQHQFGAKLITVPDSGLKRLESGSLRVLENNARLLMHDVITRTQHRIARNQANQALLAVAEQAPENGIVRRLGKGAKKKGEEEVVSVVIDGQTHRLAMPRELARQWVESDPAINSQLANVIGWVSGANILRPMATGLNPEFALSNMPRDMTHVWLTTHEYSAVLPKFMLQLAADLKATAGDAVFRRGSYVDYIMEGGGMGFLTHQGRLTSEVSGKLADLQKVLGYIGETSEVWVRLALRNRALRNGKAPHEATWIARNYLDFAQGGWAIKGADTAIPYLSAAVQATRGLARAGKENPKELAFKVAQLGVLSYGLYLANRLINEDAWDAIPAREKVNNFIITTPLSFTDEQGNTRYLYVAIAKDQAQRVFSSVFEAMAAKAIGDPVDGDQVAQAVGDFFPLMPGDFLPPTMSAWLGYAANKDFWRNEDIWKGPPIAAREEYTRYTHPSLIEAGELTGMSPERMGHAIRQVFTYGNIYTTAVGAGTRVLFEAVDPSVREQTTQDLLRQVPGMRRVLKVTDPFEPWRKQIEDLRLEEQTKRFVVNREADGLSERFYRAQKEGKPTDAILQEALVFIGRQPPAMQESLNRRHEFFGQVFEIPDRRFWLSLHGLSPEGRATVFFTRYMQTEPEERRELLARADSIKGIVTERFMVRFRELASAAERDGLLRKARRARP